MIRLFEKDRNIRQGYHTGQFFTLVTSHCFDLKNKHKQASRFHHRLTHLIFLEVGRIHVILSIFIADSDAGLLDSSY